MGDLLLQYFVCQVTSLPNLSNGFWKKEGLSEFLRVRHPQKILERQKEEFFMLKKITLMAAVLILTLNACAPLQVPAESDSRLTESPAQPADQESALLTESGDSEQVVIHWQRSGGFAGICQQMDIFADGHAVLNDCDSNRVLASGDLSEQDRQLLKNYLVSYQEFGWKFSPPKGSADMFLDEFTFSGIGEQPATGLDDEKINLELAEIAQSLLRQPSNQ